MLTQANTEPSSRSVRDCSVCTSTALCEAWQMARWKAWSRCAWVALSVSRPCAASISS
ncbi:Uncharacterised protein [Bordetella pertussis]|nr:Uncharacterised protein [Bordetella pertussis]CFP59418.1 Uncharacterised protein [Bordetella pertussis]